MLKSQFDRQIESRYLKAWQSCYRNAKVELHPTPKHKGAKVDLSKSICASVDEFANPKAAYRENIKKNCNAIIGKLRETLAIASLEFINPDLIVLDEFQNSNTF
ncbi:MAG: hypothetical protein R3C03_23395 [Pirellulaceae bacterium]